MNRLKQESIPVGGVQPTSVATTRHQCRGGEGALVNKFEQLSREEGQMSVVVGDRVCPGVGYREG